MSAQRMLISSMTTDLLLDCLSVTADSTGKNGKGYKVLVLHQLCCRECGKRIDEKFSSLGELSNRHVVERSVDLETITPIPVSSRIDQPDK